MSKTTAGSHSHSAHQFSQVPKAEIPRSRFNRSCGYKTTFNSGYLVPIFLDEALPGDTFKLKTSIFARLSTPLFPFMDNMFLDLFYFAIPYRLVWNNFQRFMGEQANPDDSTDFLIPQIEAPIDTGFDNGSLFDYFGVPTQEPGFTMSTLWNRAYNLTWNEFFRDQNLQDSVVVDKGDGPDDPADYILLKRGKRHDYFTSSLPWPQKGPAVTIPLTGNAPVHSDGTVPTFSAFGLAGNRNINATPSGLNYDGAPIGATADIIWQNTGMQADLSAVTAATINQLRQAFQIQKLYERDARGGTRYTEIILAHFGVTSPDARLQRPEYLGGGSTTINVNPIAQTSANIDQPTPQGNLAAIATASHNGHGFTKSFVEHTLIIGLVSVRADLSYQQGLNKMFSRNTKFDLYWPALSHIGEQAVLNKEIYMQSEPTFRAENNAVFGYQERFAEYRYKPSQITGQFRSNFAQTLDGWHLAQNFTELPTLSPTFIQENPPVSRVIAVPSSPQFMLDAYFDLDCARPMPLYGVPGLIDHF